MASEIRSTSLLSSAATVPTQTPPDTASAPSQSKLFSYLQSKTGLDPLPKEQEERMEEVVRHWQMGDNVFLFDLLALEIITELDHLCPDDFELRDQFINIYMRVSSLLEIGLTNRFGAIDKKIVKELIQILEFAAKAKHQIALPLIQKKAFTKDKIKALKRLETTALLFHSLLGHTKTSEFLAKTSLNQYYKSTGLSGRENREHIARFFSLIQRTSPGWDWKLGPETVGKLVNAQLYGRIAEAHDVANQVVVGLNIKVQKQGTTPQLIYYIGDALKKVRIFTGLKLYFEPTQIYHIDRKLIEERARDNIAFFYQERDKGPLSRAYKESLAKIYENLGDSFDILMRVLSKAENLELSQRKDGCHVKFPAVMKQIKKEIKRLHARAVAGEFGPMEEIREGYVKAFESLLSLFIILHDLSSLRNLNRYQLNDENLPPDLLDYADLELEDPPVAPSLSPVEELSLLATPSPPPEEVLALLVAPSPSPPPEEEPALLVAPSPSSQKEPFPSPFLAVHPSAKTLAPVPLRPKPPRAPVETKEHPVKSKKVSRQEALEVPSEGTLCSNIGRFLIKNGFYLARDTHHRYYRHFQHRDLGVKVPHHKTLHGTAYHQFVLSIEELTKRQTASQ